MSNRFEQLWAAVLDETIASEELAELRALVAADPALARRARQDALLDGAMQELADNQRSLTAAVREALRARSADDAFGAAFRTRFGQSRSVHWRNRRRRLRSSRPVVGMLVVAVAAGLLIGLGVFAVRGAMAPITGSESYTRPAPMILSLAGRAYAGDNPSEQVLASGLPVPLDAEFTVDTASEMTLGWDDGSEFTLGPGRYRHGALGEGLVVLDVMEGTIECEVSPQIGQRRFAVYTPRSQVSVVGTQFSISVQLDQDLVVVSEGVVEVGRIADGSRVMLSAGQRVVVGENDPLAVIRSGQVRAHVLCVTDDVDDHREEQLLMRRLEQLGLSTQLAGDEVLKAPESIVPPPDLVILFKRASSSRLTDSPPVFTSTPVLVADPSMARWFGLANERLNGSLRHFDQFMEVVGQHPVTAGLSDVVAVQVRDWRLGWIDATPGVEVLATVPGQPSRALVAVTTHASGARRVFLPFILTGGEDQVSAGRALTEAGWRLFDNAVLWLLEH